MVFKYSEDEGIYKLIHYKRLFGSDENRIVEFTTLNDVDNNGSLELLVCAPLKVNNQSYRFTETLIYKYIKPLSAPNTTSQNITYQLHQNYPNPFNPATTVTFSVPKFTNVKVTVYDLLGKEIATLFNKEVNAGEYSVQWNGKNSFGVDASSGIYFVRLTTNDFQRTIKILLQKQKNELEVFDMLGKQVATVVNEFRTAGKYSQQFNASQLSSGIYYYTLRAGAFTATKHFTLVK